MTEYIKTTDAITTTWMILRGMGYAAEDNPDLVKTVSAVFDTAPAADVVERKNGSWIEDGYYNEPCVCSYCGEPCKDTVMGKPRWIYCPLCGSKNQEGSP